MKSQYLLLLALLAIFVIQIQAHGDYDDYEQWKHDFPDTCEELFKTKNCNKCQSLMWSHFKNPGQCATAFNLGRDIFEAIKDSGETPKPYDLKFFKKGLKDYCHEGFHCSQQKVEKIYNNIQSDCKRELSVKFNWSNNPKDFEDKTAYAAYGTLLTYYTGIPARKALCKKNNDGDFCSIKIVEKLTKWVKEKTNADPKAIVTHDLKFVIKGNGKKIRIPRSFFCDPCFRKMAHIYVDYVKDHRLKKSVEKNIWGSYHHLEELYLPHCTYHRRGLGEILKERSVSQLTERSAIPALGILSHHMNKLHSLAI
ncbi:hypothetical protein RhiirA1_407909 [Rhizophagus irregularis]|uniref:Uncharacterized protein n=1 Tax=Rhizophagus irregularis TaxID=588596 RepID=A0A2N0SIE9_9GLOM|nr:hypothetical protein RhiirA1_407909 [Rhizophagus irregularis]CAB4463010.1 unnamed protein product [Rhizophagus irregularis]